MRQPASTCASTWRQPMGVDPDVNLRRPASTSRLTLLTDVWCVVGVNWLASTGVNQRRTASNGVERQHVDGVDVHVYMAHHMAANVSLHQLCCLC
jgi:hypothetical protein